MRKRELFHWLTIQVAKPQSGARRFLWLAHMALGAKNLGHFVLPSEAHYQASGSEVEQLGLQQVSVSVRDVGSGFTSYAIVPAPATDVSKLV